MKNLTNKSIINNQITQKIFEIVKNKDVQSLSIIFAFLIVLFAFFGHNQGSFLTDVGREVYLPWQILEGKVLYKDLFNVYGPLGYQINALAYWLFGTSTNTLYFMGFLSSTIISFCTYLIIRLFTNKKIALYTTFLTIVSSIFVSSLFNFIFPYSYNAIYALCGAIISIYSLLLFIKKQNIKYLYAGFLLAGFSFANKIEYLPYFGFIFLCLPYFLLLINKSKPKYYIYTILSFFVFPIISFGILFLQGLTITELLNTSILIQKLANLPIVKDFYKNCSIYYSFEWIKINFFITIFFTKKTLPIFATLFILNFLNVKFVQNKFIKNVFNIFIFCLLIIITLIKYSSYERFCDTLYCWLGITCIIILISSTINYLFKAKTQNILTEDKMYLFLLTSAILLSLKGIWILTLGAYGTYSFAVLIIPFSIFISHYLPQLCKWINTKAFRKTICNIFIIAIMLSGLNYINKNAKFCTKHTKFDRGTIATNNVLNGYIVLINYLKNNTSKDAKIVILPEGAIINFLSERKSHDYHYYLIPPNVALFGEEKIISDFVKDMPEYFCITDAKQSPYNIGTFDKYAPKIYEFIQNNYTIIMGNDENNFLGFTLYKRNDLTN